MPDASSSGVVAQEAHAPRQVGRTTLGGLLLGRGFQVSEPRDERRVESGLQGGDVGFDRRAAPRLLRVHAYPTRNGDERPRMQAHDAPSGAAPERRGHNAAANHDRDRSRVAVLGLADSLPHDDPIRASLLSAPSVASVLG